MLGWTLIFMLMVVIATAATVAGGIGIAAGVASSIAFGLLLVVSALTWTLRGQA